MDNKVNFMEHQNTLFPSRYQAKKFAGSDNVVAKVDGGYKIMTQRDYRIWRDFQNWKRQKNASSDPKILQDIEGTLE